MSDTESENSQERESLSNPEDDITQEEEAQEEETIEELLIAAEEGRINKDVDAVMGYISRLYEEKSNIFSSESARLFDGFVQKTTRDDLIFDALPKIDKFPERFAIKNLFTITRQFKEYRAQQAELIGITNIKKFGGNNISKLYQVITQNDTFSLTNINIKELRKLIVWHGIYNPEWSYGQLKIYGTKVEWFAYWSSLYMFYLLRMLFDESPIDVLAELNDRPYCYVIYLGTYYVQNGYKHLIKIGKTNRKKDKTYGRIKEHQKTDEYPDCIILGIYPCGNETDLENVIKGYLEDYHVTWEDKDEIYRVTGMDMISGLISTIKEFIDNEATLDKMLELKEEIETLTIESKEKDEILAETMNQVAVEQEKNKEKDRIIAELMVQLAIEKAEKNKLLKMNQPANKVSKKLQKKLKEKN